MLKRTILICAISITSGCSLAFVKGPPEGVTVADIPQLSLFCTSGKVLPTLDYIGAALQAVSFLAVVNQTEAEVRRQYDADRAAMLALHGGLALAFGVSAQSGVKKVNDCRRAITLPYRPSSGPPRTASGPWAAFERAPGPLLPASWPATGSARLWMSRSPSLIWPYFISKHKGHVDNE